MQENRKTVPPTHLQFQQSSTYQKQRSTQMDIDSLSLISLCIYVSLSLFISLFTLFSHFTLPCGLRILGLEVKFEQHMTKKIDFINSPMNFSTTFVNLFLGLLVFQKTFVLRKKELFSGNFPYWNWPVSKTHICFKNKALCSSHDCAKCIATD